MDVLWMLTVKYMYIYIHIETVYNIILNFTKDNQHLFLSMLKHHILGSTRILRVSPWCKRFLSPIFGEIEDDQFIIGIYWVSLTHSCF